MKIALFHNMPSGGAKRYVFETTRRLAPSHWVDVYTLSCAEHEFGDVRPYIKGYHIYPFRPLPLLRSPWGRLNQAARLLDIFRLRRLYKSIAQAINAGGYDVALVHPCRFTTSPAVLRYLDVSSVYYCHDAANLRGIYEAPIPRPYSRPRARQVWLDRIDLLLKLYHRVWMNEDHVNYAAASLVLTNSDFTRTVLGKIHGDAPYTCYCGVDTEAYSPAPVERQRRVLSVGMLVSAKGFDFLIESLASIPLHLRPPLTIVSNWQDDRERSYLERLASNSQVSVQFRYMVSQDELVNLYRSVRVAAYAPIREPFGLLPLEAMACGTPVVAVAEGGVPEQIVDGETGFLVPRDPIHFGQAVLKLLDAPDLREKLGQQGRQHVVEKWNWELGVNNLVSYLEQAQRTKIPSNHA